MRQTMAIFVDAYRELNHRRLFWITLMLSGIVVAAFAAMGNDKEGLTIFHWSIPFPFLSSNFIPTADFYKFIFAELGVGFWLGWIATIIALISTASIFPDFVDKGSIDLMLSKPIGRVRLFLTKFLTGLMFAGLQVTVFTLASFLVIGLRGGDWEPWLFIAIPLVLVFYSYLFSMQAVVGLLTGSVIASIISVFLFWFLIFLVQTGDGATLAWRVTNEITSERMELRFEEQKGRIADLTDIVVATSIVAERGDESVIAELAEFEAELVMKENRLETSRMELEEEMERMVLSQSINDWFHLANTFLPKTSETISLLERLLTKHAGLVTPEPQDDDMAERFGEMVGRQDFEERYNAELDESHGPIWIIGTSLGFEAVILAFGVWRFRRRDF
ncbi:MAG: ABC transporter permease subunit [Phycisphaerales bacterium]|nr:ABC transporter permease subunit [Phycisphaerales bacterium]